MPDVEMRPPSRPQPQPMKISTMVYIFLGVMALFLLFDMSLRVTCALTIGTLLTPLIGMEGRYPHLTLLFAGVITGVISITIRHMTLDPVEMARTQHTMRWVNRVRMEALRSGSASRMKKAQELQMKYAEQNLRMMKQNMKAMALTMALILSVFAWLYIFISNDCGGEICDPSASSIYGKYPVISVPWSSDVHLLGSTLLPNWVLLYGLMSIPITQAYQKVLKYLYFRRRMEESGSAEEEEEGVRA